MTDLTNILILIHLITEATGLVARAIEAGRDVTDEELAAVFARCDRADAAWDEANAEGTDKGQTDG